MATAPMMFRRVTIIDIAGDHWETSFNAKDYHITFEVPFDSDMTPNEVTVNIFNLSKLSISRLGKGMSVTVQAGYEGNYGVLSRGKISSVRSFSEGAEKITELKITEGQDVSKTSAKKSETFKKWTRADVIIRKIVEMMGVRLAELKMPENKQYKKGYVVSGNLLNHLSQVAKDNGASVFWKRGSLVIRSLKEPTSEICLLSEETGLLGSPEYFDEEGAKGYRAKSLMQHKICPGVLVKFESRTSNGEYRVRKGRHINNGSEFVTELEAV